jgi:hypothetical protein
MTPQDRPATREIERDELLAQLRRQGFRISRYQLLRWQHRRLMPSPRRKGKGQGRGVRLLYPMGAGLQAAFLASLLDANRDFDEAGWAMWCIGFPVTRFARELLLRELDKNGEQVLAVLAAHRASPTTSLITRMGGRRIVRGTKHVRAPVGPLRRSAVPGVVELAFRVLAGQAGTLPEGEDDRWLHALDVVESTQPEPSETDRPSPEGELHTPEQMREAAVLLAREANLPRIRRKLASIPDPLFQAIRNEAQYRFEELLAPLTSAFAVLPREMFLTYFVFRYVAPTFAKATLAGIQQLGWTRPPPSPINRALQELRAEPPVTTSSGSRKKASRGPSSRS